MAFDEPQVREAGGPGKENPTVILGLVQSETERKLRSDSEVYQNV